ncbi:DUF4232 domain-containing protein [Amycolatopsis suaedae]|uniref:DUF4232 domain-containing protein n=1 Tax=Amycolatopsis suaedae TaxID=2510978 RepID=A0A4Q7J394_9PSEU|nr:DUF4232 domain-containing protein [Amycolatopsis suaedae]RZQ61961.1 DUF4232 domain-containing protein [Amycolatopsis suaedae]
MTRTTVRRTIAVAAVLGAAATTTVLTTGSAAAAQPCAPGQLTASLAPGDPGAGQRYGYLTLTTNTGQTCQLTGTLPISLSGAPRIETVPQEGTEVPTVELAPGQSAHVLLHWTGIADRADQDVPSRITVDVHNGHISTPWTLGSMDASPEAHQLRYGPVQAGPGGIGH